MTSNTYSGEREREKKEKKRKNTTHASLQITSAITNSTIEPHLSIMLLMLAMNTHKNTKPTHH